jgi:chromosomal replication initiator protein
MAKELREPTNWDGVDARIAMLEVRLAAAERRMAMLPEQWTPPPSVRVEWIQEEVARANGFKRADILEHHRPEKIVRVRQAAMYLAREITKASWSSLGRCFERDHGTILHGWRATKDRMDSEPRMRAEVEGWMERLRPLQAKYCGAVA